MSVDALIRRRVVPPNYVQRMRETEPGKLAEALGEILYNGRDQQVPFSNEYPDSRREAFVVTNTAVKPSVQRVLCDIRQCLEEYALRQVLEGKS